MREFRIDDTKALEFAMEQCHVNGWQNPHTISLHENGFIRAVVVFERFSKMDCNIHVASDGTKTWMNKRFLRAAFQYPFVQLGLHRLTGLVPANNKEALAFDLHLGFVIEGRCREMLPEGEDLIILGMTRNECRFI